MADKKTRESLTVRLRPADVERLETIRKSLGIQSDTEAVRHALMVCADLKRSDSRPDLADADFADPRITDGTSSPTAGA